jgi:C-terminal processing protease CtpA/Prc
MAPLDYSEVREIIRAQLPGVTDAELDRGALEGLLHRVRGKVTVVDPATNMTSETFVISKVSSLGDGIGYLRLATVSEGMAAGISAGCAAINATNKLTGLILDLRFTAGDDYPAVAAVVDLFLSDERPLLDSGKGVMKSTVKTNALAFPVTLLVNSETIGAAEALAEVMRETGTGLILGNVTRGAAMTSREFMLKNGRRLRIADTPVKLGNGSAIAEKGVTPDILVIVAEADERDYMDDPFTTPARSVTTTNLTSISTNRAPRRVRLTEADLVRARREGIRLDEDQMPQREAEQEKSYIRDPALARAVDLLKGLAVVRRTRS